MKKDSGSITRSDLVDLLGKINDSLDKKLNAQEKRIEAKFESKFSKMESGQKEIIHRLDRMEKRNGHARNQIKKAGKALIDV